MDWRSPPCFHSGSCISYPGVCGFAPRTSRTTAFRSSGQLAVGVGMLTRPRGRSKGRVPGAPAAKQLRPEPRSLNIVFAPQRLRGVKSVARGGRCPGPAALNASPGHRRATETPLLWLSPPFFPTVEGIGWAKNGSQAFDSGICGPGGLIVPGGWRFWAVRGGPGLRGRARPVAARRSGLFPEGPSRGSGCRGMRWVRGAAG